MRNHRTGLFLAALALGSACSKDSPTGPGSGGELVLGAAISISGGANSEKYYTVVVPAGAGALRVTLSGNSGDADLYVRFGFAPTPATFDCESAGFDSNEECVLTNPAAGTWHIAVVGFEAYSGVQLRAEVTTAPSATTLTSGTPLTNLSGAEGSRRFYQITVPAGATSLSVTTSGGSGDADLYVLFNVLPSSGNADCASESEANNESCIIASPSAGVWYVLLEGWSAYAGLTLTATIT